MEKITQDYNYNMELAQFWYKQIGRPNNPEPKAKRYWKEHLKIARELNQKFIDYVRACG